MSTVVYLTSLLHIIAVVCFSTADCTLSSRWWYICNFACALGLTKLVPPRVYGFILTGPSRGLQCTHLLASKKNKVNDHSRNKRAVSDDDDDPTAVSEAELDSLYVNLKSRLKEAEEHLRYKISRLTLHRATPSLVDSLTVELPGEKKEKQLQYVARIISKGPYELQVLPLDIHHLDAVFVSLSTKLVDYKVSMQPDRISVVIPSMTELMIQQARSVVKETHNEVKTRVRTIRLDFAKKLKGMRKGLSDDMYFRQEKELDSIVKQSERVVDQIANGALKSLG
ncbi:Ribosome recycling factor family protein [Babesia bovis T2Bo]|uniref:Ribosome recycling factor domain-containing protein n=1 Tax=Babesia bovis TaxID=5865 RepID=A7AWQ7_BABBO|nr:Ribosome recycling factor family protein [Babesia bovis T2Bo]EDO05485.1 Ribosome recycling factor family protein [Babesia bovis T2Bo]|eukprot:XP_001609053.1 hypothetical protein [Babesia bovis T2Bo]